MFLFLFILNFILMHSTLGEEANLKGSIRLSSNYTTPFQDSKPISIRNLQESPTESFDCNKVTCQEERMECNEGKSICICKKEFATIDSALPCGYERKRQLVAFLLELFVGFGGGHFYTERYLEASLKLVAFLFGIYIICLFPCTAKFLGDSCDSDCGVILSSCFYYIYSLGLASWFIIDLVWFGKNNYLDGNGQTLSPW